MFQSIGNSKVQCRPLGQFICLFVGLHKKCKVMLYFLSISWMLKKCALKIPFSSFPLWCINFRQQFPKQSLASHKYSPVGGTGELTSKCYSLNTGAAGPCDAPHIFFAKNTRVNFSSHRWGPSLPESWRTLYVTWSILFAPKFGFGASFTQEPLWWARSPWTI